MSFCELIGRHLWVRVPSAVPASSPSGGVVGVVVPRSTSPPACRFHSSMTVKFTTQASKSNNGNSFFLYSLTNFQIVSFSKTSDPELFTEFSQFKLHSSMTFKKSVHPINYIYLFFSNSDCDLAFLTTPPCPPPLDPD